MDAATAKFLLDCKLTEVCTPPYLERNMKRALDSHEAARKHSQIKPDISKHTETWKYNAQEIDVVLRKETPEWLEVDLQGLVFEGQQQGNDTSPPRKRVKVEESSIDCDVRLRVFIKDEAEEVPESRYDERIRAVMWLRGDDKGHMHPKINLHRPFQISRKHLEVKKVNGSADWLKVVAKSLKFHVEFHFDTPHEECLYLDAMVNSGVPREHTLRLWTEFMKQPFTCQSENPQKVWTNKKVELPFHRLSFKLTWKAVPKNLTKLAMYNKARVKANSKKAPISKVSNDIKPTLMYTITYTFDQFRETEDQTLHEAGCIYCEKTFESLDRLQLHLQTRHGPLRYHVVEDDSGEGIVRATIRISPGIDECEDTDLKEELDWCAPVDPFDIEKHLKGDESWIKAGLVRQTSLSSRSNSVMKIQADVALLHGKQSSRQEKWRVPKAPAGRVYYRSSNKRPLEEGDLISESDEDLAEDWVLRKERSYARDTRPTAAQKAFMTKYDEHMNAELINGKAYVAAAALRFYTQCSGWLSENRLQAEARQKANELHKDGFISLNQLSDLIQAVKEGTDTLMRDAISTNTDLHCVCGNPVLGLRGKVLCMGSGCSREFHQRCVGSIASRQGWLCPICRATSEGQAARLRQDISPEKLHREKPLPTKTSGDPKISTPKKKKEVQRSHPMRPPAKVDKNTVSTTVVSPPRLRGPNGLFLPNPRPSELNLSSIRAPIDKLSLDKTLPLTKSSQKNSSHVRKHAHHP